MGAIGQIAEIPALIPAVDLAARVVYFPVRHHSPACAWHVQKLIRELRPQAVLIEGPRDATPLIPLLVHPDTKTPIAVYATYVKRTPESQWPDRFAAYYPLCDYSPELAAIRAGLAIGAEVKFIDLTWPEKVECMAADYAPAAISLFDEHHLKHGRLLKLACQRTGARDPDDLWDHLYEVDYRDVDSAQFIRNVLTWCALARHDHTPEMLAADGTLPREQAMAAAVAKTEGKTLVVTGGFHTVALPRTEPKMPPPVKAAPDDAQVVLMRYTFEQLDRLNGYASGMPAPEFYQRQWDGESGARLLVEIARQCRKKKLGTSTADAIAALAHVQRLAHLRGHATPSREDLLDGVRSVLVKGSDDAEGVPVLALARKHLAGDRVGNVPAEAGQPPLVHDFRSAAARLKLKLDKVEGTEITLDLYRSRQHRQASRFFHRLAFLEVPFANRTRGPDFLLGQDLERIQEVWNYHWSPQTESTLIERSLYGSTLEEAAAGKLMEQFRENQQQGAGRRADVATALVTRACLMGLLSEARELLDQLAGLLAEDSAFDSLVAAMENLLVLRVSREPLEAHHFTNLDELALAAYRRACFVLPSLASTPPEAESAMLDALNMLVQAAHTLGDTPEVRDLRSGQLTALAETPEGNCVLRGGAVGLLYSDGRIDEAALLRHLRGHLHSARGEGGDGAAFLQGLLRCARCVLWQVPECIAAIHEVLGDWDEDRFVKLLPSLRLALADLTPHETDRVSRQVAAILGVQRLAAPRQLDLPASEMLRAVEVNRLVKQSLIADGLEEFLG